MQQSSSDNSADRFFTPLRFGILLALLIFAMFPQVIFGLQTFVVRDFGFFAYPLAHFQRECFWRSEIPFWNPYSYCGVPFLAQWNTMPLYPPSLIYLTLPLQWSFGFFCLMHLWLAGFGMYFLARKWVGNNFAAAFAGALFSFNGFTLNLIMWPSHLATFAWMPWVVLAVESAWSSGGRKIFLAALAGAMQMLAGGPEIILFTWTFLFALLVLQLFTGDLPRIKIISRFVIIVALVAALAAIQLLPFLDLVAHSQRNTGYIDTRWSLPLRGWMNFLVPMAFGGTWDMGVFYQYDQEWTSSYYLGMAGLWLALLAMWKIRKRRVLLLTVALGVALIFALGENAYVLPALRKIIPQLRLITHSIKYMAVIIFIAPLLAAFALAKIQNPSATKPIEKKSIVGIGALLLALTALAMFWIWKFPVPTDDVHRALMNGLSRVGFLVLSDVVIFLLASQGRFKFQRLFPLFLIVVLWLDVFTHEPTQNPTVPKLVYAPGLSAEKLALKPQPALGESRAMLAPAAFYDSLHFASTNLQKNYLIHRLAYMANCNLLDDVPKTDGFLSLSPREADDVNTLLYDKTNADYPNLDAFMGVSQITSPENIYSWEMRTNFMPLVTAGQKPYFFDDFSAWKALADTNFHPEKLVLLTEDATNFVTVTNQTTAKILNSKFTDDTVHIEAEADEPSLVVISQTYYHDWQAKIDGQPTKLLRANYAFQAVQIPAGKHQIDLTYKDRAFGIGAMISFPCWMICLGGLIFRLPRRN